MRTRSLLLLAAGAVAAGLLYRRRRGGGDGGERVDLYFSDGSLLALSGGDAAARRLLPFAREILMTVPPP